MLALQVYRRKFARLRLPTRPATAAWLMVLLLAIPTAFVSSSVSRLLGTESEESCPLTEAEECSEARPETADWELINRSAAADRMLPVGGARQTPFRSGMAVMRPAEQLGRNGCGAVLRC